MGECYVNQSAFLKRKLKPSGQVLTSFFLSLKLRDTISGRECCVTENPREGGRTEQGLNLKMGKGTKPLSSPFLLSAAGAGLDKMLTRACGKCFTVPCISQINSTTLEGVQIKWLKDSPAESDRIIIYAREDRFSCLTFIWPRCTLQISHPGMIANLMMSDVSCKQKEPTQNASAIPLVGQRSSAASGLGVLFHRSLSWKGLCKRRTKMPCPACALCCEDGSRNIFVNLGSFIESQTSLGSKGP